MTYRNDFNTAGVAIDGVPETPAAGRITWETVDGPQGGLSIAHVMDTDIPAFTWTSYWLDKANPGGGAERQCTGDSSAYGVSGPWMTGGIPNTDPHIGPASSLRTTRHIYFESPGQANGPVRRSQATTPVAVAVATVPAGYPRPKGATPFSVPLVHAYQSCAGSNRVHAAPVPFASCAPPAELSGQLTTGTADANGQPTGSAGSVRLRALMGDEGTPGDEADVRLAATVTDVRLSAGLGDYTGELDGRLPLRITDRGSSAAGGGFLPGTVVDFAFAFAVPCAATAGPEGARCALATTVEAIAPGALAEGRRSVWQTGAIRLDDGGGDGVAATAPNSPFLRQGLFVP
jgi:hypothetical protein